MFSPQFPQYLVPNLILVFPYFCCPVTCFSAFVVCKLFKNEYPFTVLSDPECLIPHPRNRRHAITVDSLHEWMSKWTFILIPFNTGHDLLRKSRSGWYIGHWKERRAQLNLIRGASGQHVPLWLPWLWVVMWTQLDLIMKFHRGHLPPGEGFVGHQRWWITPFKAEKTCYFLIDVC